METQTNHNAPKAHGENRMKFRNDWGNEASGAGVPNDMTMINGAPTKITQADTGTENGCGKSK
jgi:hypothetical protein